MTWSLLEMARSLLTCPWEVLARAPFAPPAPERLPPDLGGLSAPWGGEAGSIEAILAALPGQDPGAARATWMPLHGAVSWTSDPAALDDDDALARWMRVRLSDAFHAARVALLAGDQDAARMSVAIVAAFRARHPLGSAAAWTGAMEAALRAVRLLHVGALLREARARHGWDAPSLDEIGLALGEHEAFLRSRCDWRLHFTGNHHLVALAGTFLLALHLPPGPARARRARRMFRLFWREFRREVGADGVHFESSTGYHLLAAETAAHVALVGARHGLEPGAAALRRLRACADATVALARPDGTLAAIGDGDDGAFLDLSPSSEAPPPLDATPALALLALATEHALAAARALPSRRAREAALWLCGADAASRLESRAKKFAPRAACFPDGGMAVLAAAGAHVTVSATARGRAGTGGHGHDDAGAYELWLDGPLVVDRGTGAYGRDPALRVALRSASAHSVVQLDGREMNGPARGVFQREEWAKPLMTGFTSARGGAIAIGHHGFCRAPAAVTVLRSLDLSPSGELEVIDELVGSGASEHEIVLRLPLAPGVGARVALADADDSGEARIDLVRDGRTVATCTAGGSGADGQLRPPRVAVVEARHAPRQGEIVAALTLELTWRLRLPARLRHALRPAAP